MSLLILQSRSVAIIGGGPAGLMAAEVLAQGGVQVDLYDSMPSVGRKFLVAGKGGLNLTHAESREQFLSRYGAPVHSLNRSWINLVQMICASGYMNLVLIHSLVLLEEYFRLE